MNMAVACGNVSFAKFAGSLERDIEALGEKNPAHFQSIADRLISFSQKGNKPNDAIKISGLAALFLDKIKQFPQTDGLDQLSNTLQLLLNPFPFMPRELLVEIFMCITVPDLLNVRLSNKALKEIIDNNSSLQARIAHFAMEKNGVKLNITSEELRYYLIDDKLSVEIKNSLCMWKVNRYLPRALPWITHLIVNDAEAAELKELLTHLIYSKRIAALYLCNCKFDQDSFALLLDLTERQNSDRNPIILYLYNCKLPPEKTISSFQVVQLDENEKNKFTIEQFLGTESDKIALNEFETIVSSDEISTEEVMAYAQSLKPWMQLPIISSIWYSAVMSPEKDGQNSPREIRQQAWDFLNRNPHHAAIIAAIGMYRQYLEISR